MIYVILYNCLRFTKVLKNSGGFDISRLRYSAFLISLCGFFSGVLAGLLGIGGGIICVPAQQLLLKMPLKRAISNSAAVIASIALIGAFYKNITLQQHNIELVQSLKIAACVIPGAVIGGLVGGKALHKLPENIVRAVFVLVAALACYKLLVVSQGS